MTDARILVICVTTFVVLSPVAGVTAVAQGATPDSVTEAGSGQGALQGAQETDSRNAKSGLAEPTGDNQSGPQTASRHSEAGGDGSGGGNDSDREPWIAHSRNQPRLFQLSTSAAAEPSVGESTNVSLELRARMDAENVSVALPDYQWVRGDDEQFDLGQVTTGETYTVSTAVTPTEEIARYLRFTVSGQTTRGRLRQSASHDLSVVDRWNNSGSLQVAAATNREIADTTVDAWGARNVSASVANVTQNSGTVEGCFYYQEADGSGREPGRQLYVEVRDQDIDWDNTLATGRTRDNGCFSITVNDPQSADFGANNVADVYVRVYARNPAAFTANGATRVEYRTRAPDGGTRELGNGGTVDLGDFVSRSDAAAYQAVDWALEERRYVEQHSGWSRSTVRIQFPQGDWASSISGDGFERLSMPARDACGQCDWRRSTLYHEYAHAMFHIMYEDFKPNWPNSQNYAGHTLFSETDDGFAVIEGWAEFMEGEMDREGYHSGGPGLETNSWFDGPPENPTDDSGNDLPDRDQGEMDGHRTEGSIASILYDLSDGTMPGNDDTVNATFHQIFHTVEDHNIQSIDDFLNNWDHGQMEGIVNTSFRYGVEYPDPYEDNDRQSQAAQLSTDTTINASTTNGDTTDWYTVTVPAWTVLNVTVDERGQIRPADTWLAPDIHTETDGNVGTYVDAPNVSWASEVRSPQEQAQTYDIRVSANNPTAYELDVDTEPANDYFEGNDDRDSAAAISPGTVDNLRVVDGETDFYAVDVRQGVWLNVSIDDQNSEDLNLMVEAPSGIDLANSTAETDGESVSVRAESSHPCCGSTHLIRVRGDSDDPVAYSMDIETREPSDLWAEPNEDRWGATPVSVPFEGDLRITSGDTDFFEFDLQQGQVVNVSATYEHADGGIDLYAYDPNGNQVDRDISDRDDASVSINPGWNGTYYVEVGGHPATINDYQLEISPEISAGTTGDNNNDYDDAVLIGPGRYDDLAVSGDDRNDYYQIRVEEDQVLRADVFYEHTGQATDLWFSTVGPDPNEECIRFDNCNSIPTGGSHTDEDNESAEMAVHQDGIVFLHVNNPNVPADRTPYDLRVNLTDDDRFEQNDYRTTAAELSHVRTENLHYHAEDDYYQFEATAGQPVNVTALFNASSARGLDLAIEGPSANDIATAESYGDNEAVEFTPSTNGTHYIQVYSFGDFAISRYDLVVEGANLTRRFRPSDFQNTALQTVAEDVVRPESLLSTRTLTPNRYGDLALSGGSTSQYAVQLRDGEQLNTSVAFDGAGGGVNLTVYDSEGNAVGSTGDLSQDGALTVTADEGGRYFVRARNDQGAESEFSLDVTTRLRLSDGFEFNDNRASATNVSDRTYDGLRIGEGDTDYYAVDLASGDELTATAAFEHSEGNLEMTVYGPSGTRLQSSSSTTDDESATITAQSDGTHYIEVTGASGATADYALTVDVTVPNNDRFEANDEFSTATDTTAGTYEDLRVARGDSDMFALELDRGEHVEANLTDTVTAVEFHLYGPDRTQLASSYNQGAERLAFTANESGTYYLEATAGSGTTGDYDLSVATSGPVANDQYESNDAQDTATPLEGGTYDDLAIVDGELDVYAVSLSPDQPMTATVRYDSSVGDLGLAVAGPDGEPLGGSDTATDDEQVQIAAEANGTHYVVVSGADGATAPYALTLDSPDPISAGDASSGTETSEEAPDPSTGDATNLRSIGFGASVDGEIDVTDPQSAANRGYHEPVTFRGRAGEVVTATMQSEEDAYLILRGPDGEVVAADDDSAAGLNAQLARVEIPETGQYTLVATSFWADRTLEYTLSLERQQSATGSTEVTGVVGTAIPGETVTLEFTLTNTGPETQPLLLYSHLGDLPDGWEIVDRTDAGGAWQASDRVWLFQEVGAGNSVAPSLTLSVPGDAATGVQHSVSVRAFNGTYNETANVTIPVRDESLASLLDADGDGELDDSEMLTAINRWNAGETIADSERSISDSDILRLTSIWRENRGV